MTLQQLRYIVALDNLRHFGEAAEACMVTQPTLTMQLKKLEDEMGVLLFDRSRSPVKTTALPENFATFIPKSRVVLSKLDAPTKFTISLSMPKVEFFAII